MLDLLNCARTQVLPRRGRSDRGGRPLRRARPVQHRCARGVVRGDGRGGLRGLDVVLELSEAAVSAEQVWLDWLVALAIFQEEGAPAIHRFADEFNADLDTVGNTAVGGPPRTVDGEVLVTDDFLPLDRPARIGVTSGASTPDSVVQECLERIVLIKKLAAPSESE